MNVASGAIASFTSKRDIFVETAFGQYQQNGIYATGIDLIMRTAVVSKRTL